MREVFQKILVTASSFLILGLVDVQWLRAADEPCGAARLQVEAKRELLDQYLEALAKASADNDQNLMTALNHSISSLINEIGRLKEVVSQCPREEAPESSQGLSPVRTDPGMLATASCAELTKRHLLLSRKINSMSRRQQSLFSEPTPEERSVFRDAEIELKDVEIEIRSRCSQPRPSPPRSPKPRSGSAQR